MSIGYAIAGIVVLLILLVIVRVYNARVAKDAEAKPKGPAAVPARQAKERSKVAHESTPYHAVSIKFAPNACDAAKAMAGKRFLSAAAPRLPLRECNVLECKCRFVHHADRRSGDDRRSRGPRGFGSEDTGTHQEERRKRPERRHDDDDDAQNFFR